MNINITQAGSKKVGILILSSVVAVLISGCGNSGKRVSPATKLITTQSSMQLQAIQAKEFEATKKIVFASTMSVFQDLGYAISNADLDTGLISAKSPTKGGWVFGVGQVQNYLSATAFVEKSAKNKTKVRLNFIDVEKTDGYNMQGGSDTPIEEPATYQDAFNKIQKAIFVRKNI